MKRLVLVFTILAMLLPVSIDAQKKHRATHVTTNDTVVLSQNEDAIAVYSDTAEDSKDSFSATEDDDNAAEDDYDARSENTTTSLNPDDYNDPFTYFSTLWGVGIGGVLIALFIVLLCLLFLALPFILLFFLLRYLWKSQDNKAELERMRMERGGYNMPPTPDDPAEESGKQSKWSLNIDNVYDGYMFRKGVQHISIGVGLMLMFWFMGAESIVGVGALIACFGVGQVFISRTTVKKDSRKGRDEEPNNGSSSDKQR